MVKDMHFVHETIPVEILPKIGPVSPKVKRLRRFLTVWLKGWGRGPSYGAVDIQGIGIVIIIEGEGYMGPGAREQGARYDNLIFTTIADVHNKVMRVYTKPPLVTPSIKPKSVIAVEKPKGAEDTIARTGEVSRFDP